MRDTRTLVLTIVGTGVGLAVLLTGVMFALIGGVHTRIDGLSARMDRIETRLDGVDERLRNVEIAFGQVDQRLLTIERVVLPGPDADQ
ncbi:MAG: hypothetical protein OXF93_19490 [Acidobacteria bacterium]|nr:hypothetical protein [Acidobacteriota bacterium]